MRLTRLSPPLHKMKMQITWWEKKTYPETTLTVCTERTTECTLDPPSGTWRNICTCPCLLPFGSISFNLTSLLLSILVLSFDVYSSDSSGVCLSKQDSLPLCVRWGAGVSFQFSLLDRHDVGLKRKAGNGMERVKEGRTCSKKRREEGSNSTRRWVAFISLMCLFDHSQRLKR